MEYLVFNKKVKKYFDLTDEKNGIDNNGHGTMMCSLILGNKGLLGIAPEVQLYSYKVVDSSGKVKPQVLARAINRTINDKVNIINISLGSYFENAEKDCDILAPGVDINTTLNTGEMSITTGTSQSTALISGYIALIKDYALNNGCELHQEDIKKILHKIKDNKLSYSGGINMMKDSMD